jgi:hypothetical protein
LALKVQLDHKVLLVFRALSVLKVQLDHKVLLVLKVLKVMSA